MLRVVGLSPLGGEWRILSFLHEKTLFEWCFIYCVGALVHIASTLALHYVCSFVYKIHRVHHAKYAFFATKSL